MTKYMAQKEYDRMLNTVLDEETGMTEMDLYEWWHPYDDIIIIKDESEVKKVLTHPQSESTMKV